MRFEHTEAADIVAKVKALDDALAEEQRKVGGLRQMNLNQANTIKGLQAQLAKLTSAAHSFAFSVNGACEEMGRYDALKAVKHDLLSRANRLAEVMNEMEAPRGS